MSTEDYIIAARKIYKRYGLPLDILPAKEKKAELVPLKVVPLAKKDMPFPMLSATILLKRHGCKLNTKAFNRKMLAAGFLADTPYTNSRGHRIAAKTLVNEGMNYGQNLQYGDGTQGDTPRYFEHKFMSLYNQLLFLPEEHCKMAG